MKSDHPYSPGCPGVASTFKAFKSEEQIRSFSMKRMLDFGRGRDNQVAIARFVTRGSFSKLRPPRFTGISMLGSDPPVAIRKQRTALVLKACHFRGRMKF